MIDIYLNTFCDLPGVKGGTLRGPMARSRTGFMVALGQHRACSDAGDHGAVMVWIDDDGAYRCAFMRRWQIVATETFKTKARVRVWLKDWLPQQREPVDAT